MEEVNVSIGRNACEKLENAHDTIKQYMKYIG